MFAAFGRKTDKYVTKPYKMRRTQCGRRFHERKAVLPRCVRRRDDSAVLLLACLPFPSVEEHKIQSDEDERDAKPLSHVE